MRAEQRSRAWLRVAVGVLPVVLLAIALTGRPGPVTVLARPAESPFRPSSLWLSPDGDRLYVAGAGSGSVAVVDPASGNILDEYAVGRSLTALAGSESGDLLAACDPASERLWVVGPDGSVMHEVTLPGGPWRCVVFEDDEACFAAVSRKWARRVEIVELRRGQTAGSIQLDFCPGELLFVPGRNLLVVADAFGGNVAVYRLTTSLDPSGQWLVFADPVIRRQVPAHNIRGLATDSDGRYLVLTHMLLTETAPTTRENVHWGITMTSNLRILPLDAFLEPEANPFGAGRTHFVGDAGHAAGDPGAVMVTRHGTVVLCLSGVHDVGTVPVHEFGVQRIDVGKRPVALALDPTHRIAYVANYFDDSIDVVDLVKKQAVRRFRLREPRPPTLVELGEQLFYDATLSLDGWYSCNSCHTDGHTCGLNADTLGDGSYGAPKNIPTLLGTGQTGPWGWIGVFDSLHDQVEASLRTSMRSPRDPSPRTVAALVAYLRSLPRPPQIAYRKLDQAKVERGRRLFKRLQCDRCHRPVGYYTSESVVDVGLDDGPGGNRAFNPPSLFGLAYTAPYLHDGRARTLREVFTRWRHKIPRRLTEAQIDDLVEYLLSL